MKPRQQRRRAVRQPRPDSAVQPNTRSRAGKDNGEHLRLRPGRPEDAPGCAAICCAAFCTISKQHNFPPDFPSAEVATGLLTWMLNHPQFYSVIAERDGKIVGSNFLGERNPVAGVGPITVDPAIQNIGIGRQLMNDVHDRAVQKNFAGARLIQAGNEPAGVFLPSITY